MQKLLDSIFENKPSKYVPLILSGGIYLLFAVFGDVPDKSRLLIITPLVSLLAFWGVYLIFFIQVKNPHCPDWFYHALELLVLLVFGTGSMILGAKFITHMDTNFSPMICAGMMTWSSVSFVHKKNVNRISLTYRKWAEREFVSLSAHFVNTFLLK